MAIVNLIPKAEAAEQAIRWEPKSFDIFDAVAREMEKPRRRKTPLDPRVLPDDLPPVAFAKHTQPLDELPPLAFAKHTQTGDDEPPIVPFAKHTRQKDDLPPLTFAKHTQPQESFSEGIEAAEMMPLSSETTTASLDDEADIDLHTPVESPDMLETVEEPVVLAPLIDEAELARLRDEARQTAQKAGWEAGFADGKAAGFAEGREEGFMAGREEGLAEGHTEGHAEGHKTGYYAGYEEGSARGYEEGSAKGLSEGTERGHAEGFQQGQEAGHQEGYTAGFQEGSKEGTASANQLAVLLESFKERLTNAEQELAEDLLALSLQIADQIMMTALHIQPELLLPVVRQAIQTLPQTNQPIRICVNDKDAELLERFLTEQGIQEHCKIVGDPTIQAGGCKIESESSLIDATLKNRRERVLSSIGIYREWLENRGV